MAAPLRLITGNDHNAKGISLDGFYSEVIPKGKKDMAWEISSTGFLMTLSSYIPDLLEEDFSQFTARALAKTGLKQAGHFPLVHSPWWKKDT